MDHEVDPINSPLIFRAILPEVYAGGKTVGFQRLMDIYRTSGWEMRHGAPYFWAGTLSVYRYGHALMPYLVGRQRRNFLRSMRKKARRGGNARIA